VFGTVRDVSFAMRVLFVVNILLVLDGVKKRCRNVVECSRKSEESENHTAELLDSAYPEQSIVSVLTNPVDSSVSLNRRA